MTDGASVSRAVLLERLADRIATIERPHVVRVAIDGMDTAGKTTLADELGGLLIARGRAVIRISADDFHRPRADRYRRGPDSPQGYYHDTFDCAAMRALVLDPLGPDGDRCYRRASYDLTNEVSVTAAETIASPEAILLMDGVFLLRPELNACWDFRIYLAITFETLLRRAVLRDAGRFGSAEAARARYEVRYIPGQRLYLDAVQPHRVADMVIDHDDPAHPVIR